MGSPGVCGVGDATCCAGSGALPTRGTLAGVPAKAAAGLFICARLGAVFFTGVVVGVFAVILWLFGFAIATDASKERDANASETGRART